MFRFKIAALGSALGLATLAAVAAPSTAEAHGRNAGFHQPHAYVGQIQNRRVARHFNRGNNRVIINQFGGPGPGWVYVGPRGRVVNPAFINGQRQFNRRALRNCPPPTFAYGRPWW